MAEGEPFHGRTLIADSSVWIKLPRAPREVQEEFREALRRGQIRGSSIVQMEILFGCHNAKKVEEELAFLEELKTLPITATICHAARTAVVELAGRGSDGNHKVPFGDVLIAATAAEAGFGVLHHDRHFDKLAEVMSFDSVWLASRGAFLKKVPAGDEPNGVG